MDWEGGETGNGYHKKNSMAYFHKYVIDCGGFFWNFSFFGAHFFFLEGKVNQIESGYQSCICLWVCAPLGRRGRRHPGAGDGGKVERKKGNK